MAVGLSLAASSLFMVDKVSKVYVRTCITLEPRGGGGSAQQDNLGLIFIVLAIISISYEHHQVYC